MTAVSLRRVVELLDEGLAPYFDGAGYAPIRRRRGQWYSPTAQRHVSVITHGFDPYAGGRFTLEFEAESRGHLGGCARLGTMLRSQEYREFVDRQNQVIASLHPPPEEHVEIFGESLRATYLRGFEPQPDLHPDLWMRVLTEAHIASWLELIVRHLPALLARSERMDPGTFYLGKRIEWE